MRASGCSPVLVKVVALFLVFVAVLAMFGKLGVLLPKSRRKTATACPACGRHRIGKGPCPCGKG